VKVNNSYESGSNYIFIDAKIQLSETDTGSSYSIVKVNSSYESSSNYIFIDAKIQYSVTDTGNTYSIVKVNNSYESGSTGFQCLIVVAKIYQKLPQIKTGRQ
jgi:hypothetical protein